MWGRRRVPALALGVLAVTFLLVARESIVRDCTTGSCVVRMSLRVPDDPAQDAFGAFDGMPASCTKTPINASSSRLPCGIPKIIHQSWKDKDLTPLYRKWSTAWQAHHPGWEYRLWTDDDNRRFIRDEFPWFLEQYDAFDRHIFRVDLVRFFYLFKYGGMYADLDFEPLRSLEALLWDKRGVVVGQMGSNASFAHSIPNAWMASPPGHPFWRLCVHEAVREWLKGEYELAEAVGGPIQLTRLARQWRGGPRQQELAILPPGLLYPLDWNADSRDAHPECWPNHAARMFDPDACKALFPEAYAITYWTHSWEFCDGGFCMGQTPPQYQ